MAKRRGREGTERPAAPATVRKPLLFLSHVMADSELVTEVAAHIRVLTDGFVRTFAAEHHIDSTDQWLTQIERSLLACDAIVAFVQPAFRESLWTDQEVGYALGRKRFIIPVMLRADFEPYGFMNRFQAIRAHDLDTADLAVQILGTLWSDKSKLRPLLSSRLHHLLVESRASKDIDKILTRLESLAPDELHAPSLRWAKERNHFLRDGHRGRRTDGLIRRADDVQAS